MCQYTYTSGIQTSFQCQRSANGSELCDLHAITCPSWEQVDVQDFVSFLMTIMDPNDIYDELVARLVVKCEDEIHQCLKHGWDGSDIEHLYDAVAELLEAEDIPHDLNFMHLHRTML